CETTKQTKQLLRSNDRSRQHSRNYHSSLGKTRSFGEKTDSNSVPLLPTQSTSSKSGSNNKPLSPARHESQDSSSFHNKNFWNVSWSATITVPKVARIKQIMRSAF